MDEIPAEHLKKLPEKYLENLEKDGLGTIYDDILTQLQIRPESCRLFFEENLRPYRNKQNVLKLITKGDGNSLRKLSDQFLSAFGNIVWAKKRLWLIREDELQPGQKPLRYIPPRDRQEGDHEVFLSILEQLWKRMRNTIYDVESSFHNDDLSQSEMHSNSRLSLDSNASKKEDTTRHQRGYANDRTLPRSEAPPSPLNEVCPTGFWPASRTQEAIMNIIVDLHTTRVNSHPEVFEQAYEENMARLEEWIEQDRQAESREDTDSFDEDREQDNGDRIVTNVEPAAPTSIQNVTSIGLPMGGTDVVKSLESLHEQRSFVDAHRPSTLPYHPLSAYLPPVLPSTMLISITPFHHPPSSSNIQPYLWPSAPVLVDSYPSFTHGVRLRANVPNCIDNEKLVVVLGYGWNDRSRVVRGEEDWRNGFMGDLTDASIRLFERLEKGLEMNGNEEIVHR